MLPDYIVYDELRRREELEEVERRPYLEVPRYVPYWPDPEPNTDHEDEEDADRGVVIIQM